MKNRSSALRVGLARQLVVVVQLVLKLLVSQHAGARAAQHRSVGPAIRAYLVQVLTTDTGWIIWALAPETAGCAPTSCVVASNNSPARSRSKHWGRCTGVVRFKMLVKRGMSV
jgi:hypothetical protein